MTLENAFSLANMLALAGWAALLASPFVPRLSQAVSAYAVPLLLSVAYTAVVLSSWSGADGGFSSLADVATLLGQPVILLAGWIHYLAFDLFVGAWEVRTARRETIPFFLVVPCLALTFLFGPAGFLAFMILRAAINRGVFTRPANA